MKKLILILPFILLASCSLQKRNYQKGYYVDWHLHKRPTDLMSKLKINKSDTQSLDHSARTSSNLRNEKITADGSNTFSYNSFEKQLTKTTSPPDTCDYIVFMNGKKIATKIIEVNSGTIKYKRCDVPDGPVIVNKRHEISRIVYSNGTKLEIDSLRLETIKLNKALPTHPLASFSYISAWLSIISGWVIGVYFVGMGIPSVLVILPFLLGLFAMIGGILAAKKIKAQPTKYKGKGKANWAFVLGLFSVIIYTIVYLAVLYFFV